MLTCELTRRVLYYPFSLIAREYKELSLCDEELNVKSVDSCLVGKFRSSRYLPTGRLSTAILKNCEVLNIGSEPNLATTPVSNRDKLYVI
jgi:hypothetical protein